MKTYDEILNSMKEKYLELSGNEVPYNSDIDIRMKVLAGEIYKEQVNLEFIKKQMFVRTATGEYLDLHASDRGITRRQSVKATGKVRFSSTVALEEDLNIPKGTIVATSGSIPHQYTTDVDAVISAGKKSVTVNCTAVEGGAGSNAVAGVVNILITTVPGVETVKNTVAFSGGIDIENDESLRERVVESYNFIPNGTNRAYYKKLALSVPGVTEASVVPKAVGEGTVDVYINSNRKEPDNSLVQQVQALMDQQREINVVVFVIPAKIIRFDMGLFLTIEDNYDFNSVSEKVRAEVTEYINSLPIGTDILENHLGKIILGVEGVYNYSFSDFYTNTYYMPDDSFPVLNSLTIEEE